MSARRQPPKVAARKWRNGEIVRLRLDGWTQDEIARRVGVNRSTVSRILSQVKVAA